VTVNLDEHNRRRDNIIAHEKATHDVANVETGRLMRDKLEDVFYGVAGFAAVMEAKVQQLSVELEDERQKVAMMEAVSWA
jgi:hypothetical protein